MGSTLHRARAPAHGPYGPDTSAARRWTRRRGGAGGRGAAGRRTRRRGAPAGGPPRRPARRAFSTPIGHWAAGPFVLPGVRKSVLKIGGSAARVSIRLDSRTRRPVPGAFPSSRRSPPVSPTKPRKPTAAEKAKAEADKRSVVARNKKARYDYHIDETFEAGMSLTGTEVKSLRMGRASLEI